MKCLSVKQPWASLIASGQKTVELRSWQRDYRGSLVICAGASPEIRWGAERYENGPLGVTVALVELYDIVPLTSALLRLSCVKADTDEFDNWFAWKLGLIRQLPPVPVRGQLGLWDAPEPLRSALLI